MLIQYKPRLHIVLSINNLHWNQYCYENQASVGSIRNLKRVACKMKCRMILWEDTWVKAEGSLKWSSGYDISFHNNLSQTVSPQLCVHYTAEVPDGCHNIAVTHCSHQCRQADTAIALCPCVCKCKQPNLVTAPSADISSTLVYLLSSQVTQVREIYQSF